MDTIGELKRGSEIGKNPKLLYRYVSCETCGFTRWLHDNYFTAHGATCKNCASDKRALESASTPAGIVKSAHELGHKGRGLRVNVPCPKCGAIRWYRPCDIKNRRLNRLCRKCDNAARGEYYLGAKNPNWCGGRYEAGDGYIRVKVLPTDPCVGMGDKRHGHILEHRYVMAKHLGRPLERWEVVHHKNNIKSDNRIENLELLPRTLDNYAYWRIDREISELKQRIIKLEEENRLLKIRLGIWQADRRANPENESGKCGETKRIAPNNSMGDDIVQS